MFIYCPFHNSVSLFVYYVNKIIAGNFWSPLYEIEEQIMLNFFLSAIFAETFDI